MLNKFSNDWWHEFLPLDNEKTVIFKNRNTRTLVRWGFFFCEKNCWVVNKRSVLIRSIRNKRISTEMGVVICNMKIRILYDFSVCFTAKTARCSAVFLRVIPAVEVINAENEISLVFCVPSQKSWIYLFSPNS